MAKGKMKSRKGNVISVDFTGIESGGVTLPEGKYEVVVFKVNQEESENGNDYLKWEFTVAEGKHKGKKLWHNTSLQQQSLWALRGLLEAMGIKIPDEAMDLDLKDLEDNTVGVEVQHETYNKKTQARIVDFFEVTDGEAEEEVEEDEEDEETPKSKKKAKKEEDEDDEEEAPKKSSKKKGKKETRTYTSDAILEKSEDELQEVVEEHELDVDLSDFDKLRRKRSAVIDALEASGLIEDEAA